MRERDRKKEKEKCIEVYLKMHFLFLSGSAEHRSYSDFTSFDGFGGPIQSEKGERDVKMARREREREGRAKKEREREGMAKKEREGGKRKRKGEQ